MGVSIYKRMNKNGKQSIYLRIVYKGMMKHEFTGLYTGKGKYKNLESEKIAKEIAKKRLIQLVSNKFQIEDKAIEIYSR